MKRQLMNWRAMQLRRFSRHVMLCSPVGASLREDPTCSACLATTQETGPSRHRARSSAGPDARALATHLGRGPTALEEPVRHLLAGREGAVI